MDLTEEQYKKYEGVFKEALYSGGESTVTPKGHERAIRAVAEAIQVDVKKEVLCPDCDGEGGREGSHGAHWRICSTCDGTGLKRKHL